MKEGAAYGNSQVGANVVMTSDPNYCYIEIPKQRGISVEVCQWGQGQWPINLIVYLNENNQVIDNYGAVADTKYETYNRFELKFPAAANRALVNSAKNTYKGNHFPPKVYKLIM